MYQVLTGLYTEVTAAAASGCTWNKMELILLKNFIEVDSLFERIKRQTIELDKRLGYSVRIKWYQQSI